MSAPDASAPRVAFLDGPVKVADANDPVALLKLREQNTRERFVAVEEIRLLREQVAECYRKHGVNHYEMCQEEVKAYRERVKPGQFPRWGALELDANGNRLQ